VILTVIDWCDVIIFQIQELNGKKFENPQTANLHKILEDSISISDLLKERNDSSEVNTEGTDNMVSGEMIIRRNFQVHK